MNRQQPRAIRDKQWEISASFAEGESKGRMGEMISTIRRLQENLKMQISPLRDLETKPVEELEALLAQLLSKVGGSSTD